MCSAVHSAFKEQSSQLLGLWPREIKTYVYTKICTQVFTIAKKSKQFNYLSAYEWVIKWSIHKMGYYLVIKVNEVFINATTWMNFKNIILNERSQSQNTTYCMIPSLWNVWNRQIQVESRLVVTYWWEKFRGWIMDDAKEYGIFGVNESALKLIVMTVP